MKIFAGQVLRDGSFSDVFGDIAQALKRKGLLDRFVYPEKLGHGIFTDYFVKPLSDYADDIYVRVTLYPEDGAFDIAINFYVRGSLTYAPSKQPFSRINFTQECDILGKKVVACLASVLKQYGFTKDWSESDVY